MTDVSEQAGDDIVMVPVPRKYLAAVYSVLGTAMTPPSDGLWAGAAEGGESVLIQDVRGQGRWTEGMVARLAPRLTHDATRTLLRMAAERAPKPVPFTEAAKAAGVSENKLRGELGALTKITKNLFSGMWGWPVSVRYGDEGESYYSMEPRLADWWLSALESE